MAMFFESGRGFRIARVFSISRTAGSRSEGSFTESATASAICVLKLSGQAATALDAIVTSFCQSAFRAKVRMPNAIESRATAEAANHPLLTPRRQTVSAAANPSAGRYMNRSAMIVPIGISRLEVGRNTIAEKAKRKNSGLFRRHAIQALAKDRATTPAPIVHAAKPP